MLLQECEDRSIKNIEELLANSHKANSLKLVHIRSMLKVHAKQANALDDVGRFLDQW